MAERKRGRRGQRPGGGRGRTRRLGRIGGALARADRARGVLRRLDSTVVLRGVSRRLPPSARRAFGTALLRIAPDGPPGGSDPSASAPRGRLRSVARTVGLADVERPDEAVAFARRAGRSGDVRQDLAMARLLLRLRAAPAAHEILRSLPEPADGRTRLEAALLRAAVARRTGRYREAADAARAAVASGGGARAERLARSAERKLERLAVPPSVSLPEPPASIAPVPGRALHLVVRSVEERQSGFSLRTQQVVDAQRTSGLDPVVAVVEGRPGEGVAEAAETTLGDIAYHWLPPEARVSPAVGHHTAETLRAVSRLVERLQPALLHPATPSRACRLALDLRGRYGLPVVYEVRGFIEDAWLSHVGEEGVDSDHYRLTRGADTASMLAADAVVTLGEAMRAEIVGRGIPEDRVEVVPNAVDVETFTPGPRDPALAARHGIRSGEVTIGYVSSFSPYEDIVTLIEAVAILRRRGAPVRGVLVGDGRQRERLERRVADLGLGDAVVFTGRVPHRAVAAYHRLIDVFVVSRTPTRVSRLVTPLKPFEAMACGRPVVVSRLEALLEIVREAETGLSFEAGDPGRLAAVLGRLVEEPGERHRLGEAARAWVVAERTVEQNGRRYRALYERLGAA